MPGSIRRVYRLLPLTVLGIAGISGYLVVTGDTAANVEWLVHPLNPLYYVASMVIHENWAHFAGNMSLLIPLGLLLTWLTSDRHVLAVAVTSHVLTVVLAFLALFRTSVGSSVVMMAFMAAVAVRATGEATQDTDVAVFQAAALGLVVPLAGWLFALFVVIGPSPVGHLEHFLGFAFGAAVEGIYVLSEKELARLQEEQEQRRDLIHER